MSNCKPADWPTLKLKKLFKILSGSINPQNDISEKLEYYSLPGFDKTGSSLLVYGSEIESNKTLISEPCILVSKLNPRKPRVQVANAAGAYRQCVSTEFMAYAPKSTEADLHFFKYYFISEYFSNRLQLVATGSTNSHVRVTPSETLEWIVPAPPILEQQKIATILSSVDDVIEKTRAQIDKLKDLKTGMMQELLTKGIGHTEFKNSDVGQIPKSWACELVSNLFEIQLGKMLSQAAKVGVSPLPYLGNKDVQWGRINVTDLQTMDFSERERKKFLLKLGDLLMCEGGEVGRSAIWEGELKECYYQKALHRLRPINKAYEPRLLLEYMRYAKGQNLLADFISQTSIAHLTREKLSAIPVPVPPVAEQKRIVDVVTSIDTRINRHLDKLKNTCDIKKALMQDLLTGKVRVKLTDKESAVV